MIKELFVLVTESDDPYHNLAIEKCLFDNCAEDTCYLYLWQNANTVVIGHNQNPLNECDLPAMKADGVRLVRRLSGGGAVYHDLGNMNFTFICRSEDFDEGRQTGIILGALRALGIQAEKSGRNDLLIEGRKFSGHAYYHHNGTSYHHGTLMLDVDKSKLQKYLTVSLLKLNDKHVRSVRSRVINLREIREDLSRDELRNALIDQTQKAYGIRAQRIDETELDSEVISELERNFADEKYNLGQQKELPLFREGRFGWGTVRIEYELQDDVISDIALYSDSLQADHLASVPKLIKGKKLSELKEALNDEAYRQIDDDIVNMLCE